MARYYRYVEKINRFAQHLGVETSLFDRTYDSACKAFQKFTKHPVISTVPIEICTGYFGFQFRGWHYLVELLKEYDTNRELQFDKSVIKKFHSHYKPQNGYDFVRHYADDVQFCPPFGIFPWGTFVADSNVDGGAAKDPVRTRFCGPSSDELIKSEFENTIGIFKSIREEGYQPWRRTFVSGTFLKRNNGDLRYVVTQGNHRMAVLSHLGYESVLVRELPLQYKTINEEDVDSWYYVRNGECSREDALAYFNAYFELSGFEQAGSVCLLS